MDEIPADTVRRAVHDRLDYLDKPATDGDLRPRAAPAGTGITRPASAWRSLPDAHRPDQHGRCRQCSGRLRPRPRTVRTTAHRHPIAADGSPAHRTGRYATAAGRSTVAGPEASRPGDMPRPECGVPPVQPAVNRRVIETTPLKG
ncbi:hypothetical protein GCM10009634_04990 [Saccharothrix xinjiangensis]